MFKSPLSIRDLYLLGGGLSFIFILLTVLIVPSTVTAWVALLFPLSFVTIRLVLLSNSYTEKNLVTIPRRVFSLFTGIVISILFLTFFFKISRLTSLWIVIMYGATIIPFFLLRYEIGDSYSEIEFGFRAILPENELWKSATVFLYNGETSKNSVSKFFWYTLAHQRFIALVDSLDPTQPYSNHTIAKAYREATHVSLTNGQLIPDEYDFGPIFESFTNQVCSRCKQSKPVSDLYLLTDNSILSEAFCSSCIENTRSTTRESVTQGKQVSELGGDNVTDESLDFALQVFDYSQAEFEDITPEELRSRYRELVQDSHPDTGGDEDEFKLVVSAYEELEEQISDN